MLNRRREEGTKERGIRGGSTESGDEKNHLENCLQRSRQLDLAVLPNPSWPRRARSDAIDQSQPRIGPQYGEAVAPLAVASMHRQMSTPGQDRTRQDRIPKVCNHSSAPRTCSRCSVAVPERAIRPSQRNNFKGWRVNQEAWPLRIVRVRRIEYITEHQLFSRQCGQARWLAGRGIGTKSWSYQRDGSRGHFSALVKVNVEFC